MVEVSINGTVTVDSARAKIKLTIGISTKLEAMPSTHTHPTAGRHPATNSEFDAASALLTSN